MERHLGVGDELERASRFSSVLVCAELAGINHAQVLDGVRGTLWFCPIDQSGAQHVAACFARLVQLRTALSQEGVAQTGADVAACLRDRDYSLADSQSCHVRAMGVSAQQF